MELRVLSYFLAVVREENITRAAEFLHLTQPTLSRQLMQLEEELGVKLFTRSNHKIVLTEEGMLLKRRAQEMVALAEKTKRDFGRKETELEGELVIGSGEFAVNVRMAEIIRRFHERYPLVGFRIESGNADFIKESIERGLFDFGIMSEPVDIQKYEFLSLPGKETWGVWTREDSPLAALESASPKDLDNVPLVIASRELVRSELGGWFRTGRSRMNVAATCNLMYNGVMLARSGIGVMLGIRLPCGYADMKFVPLSPAFEKHTMIAWKKNQVMSRAAAAFLEFVSQCLASMPSDSE